MSKEVYLQMREEGIRRRRILLICQMPVPVLELVLYQAGLHYTDEWKDLSELAPSKDERKRSTV